MGTGAVAALVAFMVAVSIALMTTASLVMVGEVAAYDSSIVDGGRCSDSLGCVDNAAASMVLTAAA